MAVYQVLKVFIASTMDVEEESQYAESIIQDVNRTINEPLGITLEPLRWKNFNMLNTPEERIQLAIDQQLDNSDIFLLILWRRYGTVPENRTKSNIEMEIRQAIAKFKRGGRSNRGPSLLLFFRRLEDQAEPDDQERQVRVLREELSKEGILYYEYENPVEFRYKLSHSLYRMTIRYRHSTLKHRSLLNFWDLGIDNERPLPELAVIYPPVDYEFMVPVMHKVPFWQQRLVPHVVFEDHKTMQKIEKCLRLVGIRNFRMYDVQSVPDHVLDINRVWLCLPRNKRALERAEEYADIAQFRIVKRIRQAETHILWRYSTEATSYLKVQSPLSTYLKLQRGVGAQAWKASMADIIAKDFAVLARFNVPNSSYQLGTGPLKEYFIGGIRGLGTWGAGWFIDRRYQAFDKFKERGIDNIQMLLEVTYRKRRIVDVRDVSNEPESYFRNEVSLSVIKENIAKL